MKRKIVAFLIMGCMFTTGISVSYAATDETISESTDETTIVEPEMSSTEISAEETVTTPDESSDSISEDIESNETTSIPESDANHENVVTDEASKTESESEADIDAVEVEEKDEVSDKETNTYTAIKYHLDDNNRVQKITSTIMQTGDERSVESEIVEEIGFLDEDGNLCVSHTETTLTNVHEINIKWTKEVRTSNAETLEDEVLKMENETSFMFLDGESLDVPDTLDPDVAKIIKKLDLDNIVGSKEIVASVDEKGKVTINSETDSEMKEISTDVEAYEIVDRNFEFDKEYIESDSSHSTENVTAVESTTSDETNEAENTGETEETSDEAKSDIDVAKQDDAIVDESETENSEE